jgi:hypothetical protein
MEHQALQKAEYRRRGAAWSRAEPVFTSEAGTLLFAGNVTEGSHAFQE